MLVQDEMNAPGREAISAAARRTCPREARLSKAFQRSASKQEGVGEVTTELTLALVVLVALRSPRSVTEMPPRSDRVERVANEVENLVELAVVVGVARGAVDTRKRREMSLSRAEVG